MPLASRAASSEVGSRQGGEELRAIQGRGGGKMSSTLQSLWSWAGSPSPSGAVGGG